MAIQAIAMSQPKNQSATLGALYRGGGLWVRHFHQREAALILAIEHIIVSEPQLWKQRGSLVLSFVRKNSSRYGAVTLAA